jgi:hypothetical protein
MLNSYRRHYCSTGVLHRCTGTPAGRTGYEMITGTQLSVTSHKPAPLIEAMSLKSKASSVLTSQRHRALVPRPTSTHHESSNCPALALAAAAAIIKHQVPVCTGTNGAAQGVLQHLKSSES